MCEGWGFVSMNDTDDQLSRALSKIRKQGESHGQKTPPNPPRLSGESIVVPIDMRYTFLKPGKQSWVSVKSEDGRAASDPVHDNGRRLTDDLDERTR